MTLPLLDDPAWVRTTILGDGWPTGDEAAVWDVADRWYALADALTGPRTSAFAAADQIVTGLVGAGIAPDGFREAWERLSGGEDAPLNALVQISAELGQMVEECGREIEAAKLAAWIEVGTLLTELVTLPIAIELTLGAAAPAGPALIAATRVAVEQIYVRLAARLAGDPGVRPQAADPAHSAKSDQRTIRLTVPGAGVEAPGTVGAAHPAGAESAHPASADTKTAVYADREARRPSRGGLPRPADDNGMATRRLAPRPRNGRRDLGDETRRLVAPSRPAAGRPTIPAQRTAGSDGHAFDRVRREEYADYLTELADGIYANLALMGENPALAAYADEMKAQAALIRPQPDAPVRTTQPPLSEATQLEPPSRPAPPEPPPQAAPPEPLSQATPPEPPSQATPPDSPSQATRPEPFSRAAQLDRRSRAGHVERPSWATPPTPAPDGARPEQSLDAAAWLTGASTPARPGPAPQRALPGSRSSVAPGWARPEPPADGAPGWARGAREWGRSAEEQTPGGLRRAHGVHLQALADALPAADRRPDPRVGRWFSLLNAGGPAEDPTRGVNCLDAVLALFETYQRGRPRVAGPRTFDAYAHGAPERVIGGEWLGVRRIQRAARSEFQNLCPFVGGASADQVEAAFRNLTNHLHNSGPGAFAFILTDFATGGCHAWAAVNQDGTILFLDPQLGRVSADEPLYREIASMDALVVDGSGEPAPLPYHGAGQWAAL